ncbi:MAG: ferrochelatase [Enterobacteriaceae bacterium]
MDQEKKGVLLVNLGTPSQPTAAAVSQYLSSFLSDRRVVDMLRWLWYPLLHGFILPLRSGRVARLYQQIWMEEGSPLLVNSRRQQQALANCLPQMVVELAMTYGEPSMEMAVRRLLAHQVSELVVLPLYPQYSSTTTAAVWDRLAQIFARQPRLPCIHFINDYAEHPAYIDALVNSISSSFQEFEPDLLLFSYHGIPQRYVDAGDDYPQRCAATTWSVAQQLFLPAERWQMSFQSRFGREPWLQPYTDELLRQLPAEGIKSVQVICPGFSSDCLETLEEIQVQNRQVFLAAGGERYHYIPALNDSALHIELLQQLVLSSLK